jgi:hypothetical protein
MMTTKSRALWGSDLSNDFGANVSNVSGGRRGNKEEDFGATNYFILHREITSFFFFNTVHK